MGGGGSRSKSAETVFDPIVGHLKLSLIESHKWCSSFKIPDEGFRDKINGPTQRLGS